ncbi:hypothetical protein SAMN05421504_11814 [Amycolatopsis xylanica]|uniref:Lipoprotein n=1 Tax=Amycolatopsis xylanica TaxID=589385 RepID=A0A1H3T6K6_9PSEU|nr:hypothetical protein [Amycolatopsis xylanica]SDZ45491.1 hypothetical protein SAMN05421504_11814 [Amycolatopsis xylanica]
MKRKSGKRLAAIALAVALVVTGCDSGGNSPGGDMQPTITLVEAGRKVDEYAELARQAIGPDTKLGNPDKNYDFPCSNADGSPAKNRRDARVSYQIEGTSVEKIPVYFDAIRAFWARSGFEVNDEEAPNRYLGGVNKANGFTMALKSNDLGEVYLKVSSPCVWRNGTPEPDKP